jgi:hypothetical protein
MPGCAQQLRSSCCDDANAQERRTELHDSPCSHGLAPGCDDDETNGEEKRSDDTQAKRIAKGLLLFVEPDLGFRLPPFF